MAVDMTPQQLYNHRRFPRRRDYSRRSNLFTLDTAFLNLITVACGRVPGVWQGKGTPEHRFMPFSDHYALEAWERMTQGGAIIEPAQRDNLHKISFVRKLMEDARTAIERNEAEVMSRAFYR